MPPLVLTCAAGSGSHSYDGGDSQEKAEGHFSARRSQAWTAAVGTALDECAPGRLNYTIECNILVSCCSVCGVLNQDPCLPGQGIALNVYVRTECKLCVSCDIGFVA